MTKLSEGLTYSYSVSYQSYFVVTCPVLQSLQEQNIVLLKTTYQDLFVLLESNCE